MTKRLTLLLAVLALVVPATALAVAPTTVVGDGGGATNVCHATYGLYDFQFNPGQTFYDGSYTVSVWPNPYQYYSGLRIYWSQWSGAYSYVYRPAYITCQYNYAIGSYQWYSLT